MMAGSLTLSRKHLVSQPCQMDLDRPKFGKAIIMGPVYCRFLKLWSKKGPQYLSTCPSTLAHIPLHTPPHTCLHTHHTSSEVVNLSYVSGANMFYQSLENVLCYIVLILTYGMYRSTDIYIYI